MLQGRQWQLQKLYIDPDRLRSGLGLALMTAGEQAMQAEGVELVWLLVYAGNERAQAFYRRFDYRPAASEAHDFEHIQVEFKLLVKRFGAEPTPP
jgi:ribosomal protein S18 acetylase RimI-like enzyme